MLKKLILASLFLAGSLFSQTIKIAVAANVSYAMQDLKEEFSRLYPDIKVKVILGSSGKLTAQISHGAPYQLFLSANMKYPEALYKKGLAVHQPVVYAQGSLSFLSAKPRIFSHYKTLLQDNKIRKIALANPKTAPYGTASIEALKNIGVYELIKHKFVYGESISQTVSYTVSATDIGIIATSSLYSKRMKKFIKDVHWSEIGTSLYTPIKQGIVLLKLGKGNTAAETFYNFMLSDKAKSILGKFGYIV